MTRATPARCPAVPPLSPSCTIAGNNTTNSPIAKASNLTTKIPTPMGGDQDEDPRPLVRRSKKVLWSGETMPTPLGRTESGREVGRSRVGACR